MELLGKHGVAYIEIPADTGCGLHKTSTACGTDSSCEWVKMDIANMSFCRIKSESSNEIKTIIKSELVERDNVLGYFPGVDALRRLATQDISRTPDSDNMLKQNKQLADMIYDTVVSIAAKNPEWSTTLYEPENNNRGGGIMFPQKLPNSKGIVTIPLFPGDVVVMGSDIVGEDRFGTKSTHWAVYIGTFRLPNTSSRSFFVDVGGNGPESVADWIKLFSRGSAIMPGLGGVVTVKTIEQCLEDREFFYKWEPDVAIRPRLSSVLLALATVGTWKYKLLHSNCQHFACYIATGMWISQSAMEVDRYMEKEKVKGIWELAKLFGKFQWSSLADALISKAHQSVQSVEKAIDFAKQVVIDPDWATLPAKADTIVSIEPCNIDHDYNGLCFNKTQKEIIKRLHKAEIDAQQKEEENEVFSRNHSTHEDLLKASKNSGMTYEEVVASVNRQLHLLADAYSDAIDLIAEVEKIVEKIFEMNKSHVVLKTANGRRFCWSREALANEFAKQLSTGQQPYDPVTMSPVSMDGYYLVTGKPLYLVHGLVAPLLDTHPAVIKAAIPAVVYNGRELRRKAIAPY